MRGSSGESAADEHEEDEEGGTGSGVGAVQESELREGERTENWRRLRGGENESERTRLVHCAPFVHRTLRTTQSFAHTTY